MIISAEQYIIQSLCKYPSLYTYRNFNVSSMKVMNQFLNVIGNGIRNDEELIEEVTIEPKDVTFTKEDALKCIQESIYWGYKEVTETEYLPGKVYKSPKGISITLRESELKDHPEIIYTLKSNKNPFKPYPNFHEEFSTIWKCPVFFTLGKDWIEYAIKFYSTCRRWLKRYENKYHYAFPRQTEEETIKYMKKYTERQKLQGTDEEIYKLLSDGWQKEKERIFNFIDKTLKILREELNK